ncbi:MAG: hypothetical protein JW904_11560, partial [Spirochaetales bacterium]|nr:hypothetical protein [Spirochaetales bacterium]
LRNILKNLNRFFKSTHDLLLQLPHRQFVFTIPKCLRVILKHDRELHAELSRLVFLLLLQMQDI